MTIPQPRLDLRIPPLNICFHLNSMNEFFVTAVHFFRLLRWEDIRLGARGRLLLLLMTLVAAADPEETTF